MENIFTQNTTLRSHRADFSARLTYLRTSLNTMKTKEDYLSWRDSYRALVIDLEAFIRGCKKYRSTTLNPNAAGYRQLDALWGKMLAYHVYAIRTESKEKANENYTANLLVSA